MGKRIEAIFFLAWQLVALLWEKSFQRLTKKPKGKTKFLFNYKEDGLLSVTAPQRDCVNQMGGCFHCGLCEAIFATNPELLEANPKQPPQSLFLGASRELSALPIVQQDPDWNDVSYGAVSEKLESLCPANLSFSDMQTLYIGTHTRTPYTDNDAK